ncbi:alpha/beta hydrolase [Aerophototrophica crusticola]|uniref:Alpha/beta hydrolase n=1 Tax=Aerophototrophica crusticola TaxID=1709002 RepID=A0A858R7F1_9PROT|nr:alpha/beta hydrolase [Rhodospirillaceae bacterium B3]
MLLPGLTAQGKADERLVDFALNLARAGFTVLVPDLSGRATLSAGTADVPEILATVAHLSDRLGGRQVGLVGISYAVGPAILAALEPAGRERVATLVSFGGYHDLTHMVAWVTTGQRRGPDGAWIKGSVPDLAVWFFVAGNVRLLNDPIDRHLLNEMARRRWNDATVPVGDLAARLGPEGQAVFALLTNRDPEAVPSLIGTLPERLRAELAALDLSKRDLKALPARLVLVHGKDDPVIPWTESVSLAAATDPARTDLFLIGKMGHTEVGGIGLSDALDLWRAISAVLGERERLEEQTGPRASGTGAGR